VIKKWAAKSRTAEGYSLAELLIVLAIAAILLTMAMPNVARLQKEWTLWGSAKSLETSLQWGRMHAISSNSPVLLEVSEDGRQFAWIDPESGSQFAASIRFLARGIRIVSSPKHPLRFYPRGNAAPAGTYTLTDGTESCSVIVAPGGRIRFQKK
jgi:prepilin-type N-terminal cleavage/methylation domain-containing protein